MGAFNGNNKLKIFDGSTKVKKAYLGSTKIYSAGNIVTYYVDSSTYYQEEVDSDASCLNPVTFTPSKSGWEFVGWREDTTASSSVLSGKIMGDEPVTLYAVFRQAVTLYYYNGSTTKQNKSDYRYYNNGNIVNPSFVMSQTTASGWTARGWATGTAGNASVAYSNGATITISADTTIYGLYQQTITLTYYNNSTTKATTTGTRYWNSGSNAYVNPTFTLSQASKSGWTARGWATGTAGNAAVVYSNGALITISANTTIYGLYYKTCTLTAKSYNSTKYATGTAYYNSAGNTTNATCTVPNGAAYSGWSWRGWGTSTGASASVSYANGSTYTLGTGDASIYGLYSQTIYLYYNGNSATSGSVSTQSGTRYWNAYGNYSNPTFTLASNGFSRTGYTFSKWDLGNAGATVTLSSSTTAYAQWTDNAWIWVSNYVGSGDTFKLAGNNLNFSYYGENSFHVCSEDGDTDTWTGQYDGSKKSSSYYTNIVSTRGCKYITVTMTSFGNIASYLDCDMMYLADSNGNKIASFGFSESQGWNQTAIRKLDCSAYSSIQLRGYFNDYEQYGSAIHVSTVQFSN